MVPSHSQALGLSRLIPYWIQEDSILSIIYLGQLMSTTNRLRSNYPPVVCLDQVGMSLGQVGSLILKIDVSLGRFSMVQFRIGPKIFIKILI